MSTTSVPIPAASVRGNPRPPILTPPPGPIIRIGLLGEQKAGSPLVHSIVSDQRVSTATCASVTPENAEEVLRPLDVIVLLDADPNRGSPDSEERGNDPLQELELTQQHHIGALVLTTRPSTFQDVHGRVVCLPYDSDPETVHGALAALAQLRPNIRRVDAEMGAIRSFGRRLQKHFDEMDLELRLAARIQQEFLPRRFPTVGPIRFTCIYRPCRWVSGDIFDVFRLDETHVGFYLADVVGHGVAAGLLTMFIKNTIRPKRVHQDGYELISPANVLRDLNDRLVAQELPDSQFVTGWYGVINIQTQTLTYAVAGHPPPLLLHANGDILELQGHGCLLGVFPDQAYADTTVQLSAGQRVFVYSDGLEPILIAERKPAPQPPELTPGIVQVLRKPTDKLIALLTERLDDAPGGLSEADDVSLVVMEITPEDASGQLPS